MIMLPSTDHKSSFETATENLPGGDHQPQSTIWLRSVTYYIEMDFQTDSETPPPYITCDSKLCNLQIHCLHALLKTIPYFHNSQDMSSMKNLKITTIQAGTKPVEDNDRTQANC